MNKKSAKYETDSRRKVAVLLFVHFKYLPVSVFNIDQKKTFVVKIKILGGSLKYL